MHRTLTMFSAALIVAIVTLAQTGCTTRPTELLADESAIPQPAMRQHTPPQLDAIALGQSVLGKPIHAYSFGKGKAQTVLILGGIHGTEPTSVDVAMALIDLLKREPSLIPPDTRVVIAPCLNPDGYAKRTRVNTNGVDLNRNLPASNFKPTRKGSYYTGPSPASEPETRFLMQLVEQTQPVRIVSIHSIRTGRHGNNFDGPAQSLAELMSKHNRYNVLPTMGYPTPGSFGTWAGIDKQIPTITLELPREQPGDEAWEDNREALLAFIRGS